MSTLPDKPSALIRVALPDKPSALIRVALADLAKVEADPKYRVDMSEWVLWDGDSSPCEVCFAGAVIVGTLGGGPNFTEDFFRSHPHLFDSGTSRKLHALDAFRNGYVSLALEHMGIYGRDKVLLNRTLSPYEIDRAAWRADMEKLANDLQMVGI